MNKNKVRKCVYCGRKSEGKYCSDICSVKWREYRVKLSPPDLWRRCSYCNEWIPLWYSLHRKRISKDYTYCGKSCSSKGTSKIRAASIRNALAVKSKKPVSTLNRSEHCFRKRVFGVDRCDKYIRCDYVKCSGYTCENSSEASSRLSSSLGTNHKLGY